MQDRFKALRTLNVRRYFAGQAVSMIGSMMQMVAQGWLVLRLSGYRDVSITSAGDVAIARDVTLVHTGGGTGAGSAHSGSNDTSLMPL